MSRKYKIDTATIGFAVVTEDTEEAVGLFYEREYAELFLEALQLRALAKVNKSSMPKGSH